MSKAGLIGDGCERIPRVLYVHNVQDVSAMYNLDGIKVVHLTPPLTSWYKFCEAVYLSIVEDGQLGNTNQMLDEMSEKADSHPFLIYIEHGSELVRAFPVEILEFCCDWTRYCLESDPINRMYLVFDFS